MNRSNKSRVVIQLVIRVSLKNRTLERNCNTSDELTYRHLLNFSLDFFFLLFIKPNHPNSHIDFLPFLFPLLNVSEAMTRSQHMLSRNQNFSTKNFYFPIMIGEHKRNHPRKLSLSCFSSTKDERNWQCCTTRLFSLFPLY